MPAQTYTGNSNDKAYKCSLKINSDSSIIFIYEDARGYVYGEHNGTIRRINDSAFHVSCTLIYGQFIQMSFNEDTMCILMDEPVIKLIDSVTVKYPNGKKKVFLTNKTGSHNCFPADKKFVSVTTNRKNPITGIENKFIIPFRSDASFAYGEKVDFDIVIRKDILKTIGKKTVLQTGHFVLRKRMKEK